MAQAQGIPSPRHSQLKAFPARYARDLIHSLVCGIAGSLLCGGAQKAMKSQASVGDKRVPSTPEDHDKAKVSKLEAIAHAIGTPGPQTAMPAVPALPEGQNHPVTLEMIWQKLTSVDEVKEELRDKVQRGTASGAQNHQAER